MSYQREALLALFLVGALSAWAAVAYVKAALMPVVDHVVESVDAAQP